MTNYFNNAKTGPHGERVTISVGGADYSGWLDCSIELSIEKVAATFSVAIDLIPGQPPAIKRQDEVAVKINGSPVVQGFVLAAEPFYRLEDTGVKISGRDRSGDLVQCSAIHKGGQWRGATVATIIKDLITPFGLRLSVEADVGKPLPDFKINHGETALSAISRAARARKLLATRGSDGHLVLCKAGQKQAAGEIRRGVNVIEMESIGTDEDRFSDYIVYGQGNTNGKFDDARQKKSTAKDPEMRRYLPLVVNAEGNVDGGEINDLADHTMRVKRGHAYGLRYKIDGWLMSNGQPWPINQRVTIHDDIAGVEGKEWLIAEAHFSCDLKDGCTTSLTVRPVEAYSDGGLTSKCERKKHHGRKQRGGGKKQKGGDGAVIVIPPTGG